MIVLTDRDVQTLTPGQRQALQAVLTQRKKYSFPYYSSVKYDFTRAGAGPFTYTLLTGTEIRAFAYGQSSPDMALAGYRVADGRPTTAETNLEKPNETIGGESVYITGIHARIQPSGPSGALAQVNTDARALSMTWGNVGVAIRIDATNRIPMGTLGELPGGGGLFGGGDDKLGFQPLDGGRPTLSFINNGWPTPGAVFGLAEGLTWNPAGEPDSMFEITTTVRRTMTLDSGGDPQNQVTDEVAAAGIRGYNYPIDGQLFAVVQFSLQGYVTSERSRIQ